MLVVAEPDGRLSLQGPDLKVCQPLANLRLERLSGRAMARLLWPDGAVVEVDDDGRLAALFPAQPVSERRDVAVALLLTGIGGTLLVLVGLPLLGSVVRTLMPQAVERHLGERILASLDGLMFQPSQLPLARQQRLQSLLTRLEPKGQRHRRLRLELRHSPAIGANAQALPGGILVLTDDLVRLATEDEAFAVLAHEAGHDRHRHPLQMLVRSHAIQLIASSMGGDSDDFAVSLLSNAYSRQFEYEADREAVATLRRWNRQPQVFFSILDKIEKAQGATGLPSFLLTHPSNRERRQRAAEPRAQRHGAR